MTTMDCRTCLGTPALHPNIECPDCNGTRKSVTWSTPCQCGHSSVRHANTDRWNNAGACRWCACPTFAPAAVAA